MARSRNRPKTELSRFLSEKLAELPLAEVSQMTGINISTLSSNLSGERKPSMENMLRYAAMLKVDLARLHELAGDFELARLYRQLPSAGPEALASLRDLFGLREARAHERLQNLIALGELDRVEEALAYLEGPWRTLSSGFEALAKECGAKAALLLADTSERKGRIIFRWNCAEPRSDLLAQRRQFRGWASLVHERAGLALTMLLDRPENPEHPSLLSSLSFYANLIG